MTKLLALSAIAVALAGCSALTSPPHKCELVDGGAGCASMEQSLSRAVDVAPRQKAHSVFTTPTRMEHASAPSVATSLADPQGSPHPVGQTGVPVFRQPDVHRVWVPPYVDADGNLRTGEFIYFSTPGQWEYGTTRKPGQGASALGKAAATGSATFAPVRPDALGFRPDIVTGNTRVDPTRRGSQAAPSKPGDAASSKPAAATTSDGITQPYQRLGSQ